VLERNRLFDVFFMDYGKSAKVTWGSMVAGRAAIPAGQPVEQEPA
jgi:hypothetical protein